jgi:hypothetical protein
MWSDTLLELERLHLLRVAGWGMASLVVGALLWLLVARRGGAPLIAHFSIQLVAGGALLLTLAGAAGNSLALRDHAGAVRLDRTAMLGVLVAATAALGGLLVALAGWVRGRRQAAIGGGLGVALHGAVVAILFLMLRRAIVV